MTKLEAALDEIRLAREKDGKPLPRPGPAVPIEFATSGRVSTNPALLDDFLEEVLGFGPDDWVFVSDKSSLFDFGSDEDIERYCGLVRSRYGVDVSDLKALVLADILERISTKRHTT